MGPAASALHTLVAPIASPVTPHDVRAPFRRLRKCKVLSGSHVKLHDACARELRRNSPGAPGND